MLLWHIVPTWHDIESRITDEMGYQGGAHFRTYLNEEVPSLALNLRRVDSVRRAFYKAEWVAGELLRQRFADLDIKSILNDLLGVAEQMAMIVAGSALTGGLLGAGIGAFAGGVGAFPGGVAGTAIGFKVSGWILGVLGIASLAEFFVDGLPRIGECYLDGIGIAWEGPRGEQGLSAFSQDNPFAINQAAHFIATGHVEVVMLLLGAMVSYLTRGGGNAGVLAQEMAASKKGARIGQWMLKHEEALKKRPDLQVPERRKGAMSEPQPAQPNRPAGKDKEPAKNKPSTMTLYNVDCFKADKLPNSKIGEFDRQLGGQEKGMNNLTVQEFLQNIADPILRNPNNAKRARRDQEDAFINRFLEELLQDHDFLEAEELATKKAKREMSTIAALHNPDLFAGGKDIIGGFGDRQVNSTIGPQWRTKIQSLAAAAKAVPISMRNNTFLNVKLHRC
ncbi:polymorphic toxin type 15 domain-containing protein [Pseudomonas sp. LRP2-20]|nr:polymorphic toxin type 15 domain-containing protein [Pseudomonas sp. LRP2-20]BDM21802.1 polymorphic toxin type 15 domain-containing protein [Pseudomonas sp. LRP2-20]